MKITVVGSGYACRSTSILLAQHNKVTIVDAAQEAMVFTDINKYLIQDASILKYLSEVELDLTVTSDEEMAYNTADFVVIAVPTGFNADKDDFDTAGIEPVIRRVIQYNPNALIVIRSAVPAGYTSSVRERTGSRNILFCPEFLRESRALYDCLYPSRIIVGTDLADQKLVSGACTFASMLQEGAVKSNIDTMLMEFAEAETVKLFDNKFLVFGSFYFNALDSYAELKGVNTQQVIKGLCLDPLIRQFHENFGICHIPKNNRTINKESE